MSELETRRQRLAENKANFNISNELHKFRAKNAKIAFQIAAEFGYIDPNNIKRIADFGAGTGGSTLGLKELAKVMDAEVVAIEKEKKLAKQIIESQILPSEKVKIGEGTEFIRRARQKEGEGFDLITSFMLGPDPSGNLFIDLARASSVGLNNGGNLLITSDTGTLARARGICKQAKVKFKFINDVMQDNEVLVPNVLIVPKESCLKI